MNVDNSGNTYVFTAETTQAIEEGKNRITLLQVEELRLNKLKGTLEQEIITLEASLNYVDGRLTVKQDELDTVEIALADTIAQLNKASELLDSTRKDIDTRTAAIVDREEFCKLKEKELSDREALLAGTEANLTTSQTEVNLKEEKLSDKMKRIEDFLKSV